MGIRIVYGYNFQRVSSQWQKASQWNCNYCVWCPFYICFNPQLPYVYLFFHFHLSCSTSSASLSWICLLRASLVEAISHKDLQRFASLLQEEPLYVDYLPAWIVSFSSAEGVQNEIKCFIHNCSWCLVHYGTCSKWHAGKNGLLYWSKWGVNGCHFGGNQEMRDLVRYGIFGWLWKCAIKTETQLLQFWELSILHSYLFFYSFHRDTIDKNMAGWINNNRKMRWRVMATLSLDNHLSICWKWNTYDSMTHTSWRYIKSTSSVAVL